MPPSERSRAVSPSKIGAHHSEPVSTFERLTWGRHDDPVHIMYSTLQWMWQAPSVICPCGANVIAVEQLAGEVSLHSPQPYSCCWCCCQSGRQRQSAASSIHVSNCSAPDISKLEEGSLLQAATSPSLPHKDGQSSHHSGQACATAAPQQRRSQLLPEAKLDPNPLGCATAASGVAPGVAALPHASTSGQSQTQTHTSADHTPGSNILEATCTPGHLVGTATPLPPFASSCCASAASVPAIAAAVTLLTLAAAVLASLQSITSVTLHEGGAGVQDTSVDTSVPYAVIVGVSDVCRLFLQLAVLAVLYGQTPYSLESLTSAFPLHALQRTSYTPQGSVIAEPPLQLSTALAPVRRVPPALQLLHFLWLHLEQLSPRRARRVQCIIHWSGLFMLCSWLIMAAVLAEQASRAADPSFRDSISYKAYGNADAPAYTLEVFFLVFCFIPSNLGLISAVWLLGCSALVARGTFCAMQDSVEEHCGSRASSSCSSQNAPELFLQSIDTVHASVSRAVRLLASSLSTCLAWLLLLAGLGWVSALASIIVTAAEAGQLNSAGIIATLVTVAVSILAILVLLAGGASVTFSADMVHQQAAALLHINSPHMNTSAPAANPGPIASTTTAASQPSYLQLVALRAHVLSVMSARRPGWYLFQRRIQMSTVVSVVSVLAAIASLSLQQLAVGL